MNEKVKSEIPGAKPPFAGSASGMSAQSYAALAWKPSGIGRKTILPKLICFGKVAL